LRSAVGVPAFLSSSVGNGPARLTTRSCQAAHSVKTRVVDIEAVEDPSMATHGSIFIGAVKDPESGNLEGGVTAGTHAYMILDNTALIQAFKRLKTRRKKHVELPL